MIPQPDTAETVRPAHDSDEVIDSPVPPAAVVDAPPPRTPREICEHYGSEFMPPGPHDRAGVAFETLQLLPLNVRRVMPEQGHSGWYVWGGETRSSEIGFFQSLPVARLLERCPHITPFLALAPGWRVQWTPDHYEITPPLDSHSAPSRARHERSPAYTPYRAKHERVTRYVVLSILLHVLALALLGDTGGERGTPGRGGAKPAPGGFQATIQTAPNRESVAVAPTRSAEPSRRRVRSATAEKSVQEAIPPTAPVPATSDAATEPAAVAVPLTISAEPLMPPLISTPVEKAMSDFVVPQVMESKEATPVPVRSLEPLPKLEPIAPPKSDRAIAVPAELIPRLAPITPPKPTTETALPAELIPRLAPLAPVKIERELALPAELLPRLAPIATPKINSETAVPAELVPRLAPLETPRIKTDAAVPAELVPRLAPLTTPKIEREVAIPAELIPRLAPITQPPAMEPLSPATIDRPAANTATSATNPAPARNDTATSSRAAPAAAQGSANRPAVPGPDGDIFGSRAGIPGAPGSSTPPPRIDLDAVRQRARELAGESAGPRTLLPFPTVKPKDDTKTRTQTQQAFDKALKRPDCRDVYANMGLAAVVPLVVDAVTEKGCKW